jgi:NAD(P)-dependent dehydrogenase (short-subunit alcohol dehydrogenase family)
VVVKTLDLADLSSVRSFSKDVVKSEPRLDYVILNAGVMATPFSKTKDGFELQLGTNHIGIMGLFHALKAVDFFPYIPVLHKWLMQKKL